MAKLPYMPLYIADYILDTRCLSLSTRGAWMDMLCVLWNSPTRGKRTLTLEGWAGYVGKPCSDVSLAIIELEQCGVGKIFRKIIEKNSEKIEEITIASGRMMRDEDLRKKKAKQKKNQRVKSMSPSCRHDVADDVAALSPGYSIFHISESEEEKKEEREVHVVQVSAKPSPPPNDESWVCSIESNPAYKDLHVRVELEKCKTWCEANRKIFSRRRFVNWLNRIDRPMQVNGHGAVCQERVHRGSFLKPCGSPSVAVVKNRPLCKTHKEQYDQRTQTSHTTA